MLTVAQEFHKKYGLPMEFLIVQKIRTHELEHVRRHVESMCDANAPEQMRLYLMTGLLLFSRPRVAQSPIQTLFDPYINRCSSADLLIPPQLAELIGIDSGRCFLVSIPPSELTYHQRPNVVLYTSVLGTGLGKRPFKRPRSKMVSRGSRYLLVASTLDEQQSF